MKGGIPVLRASRLSLKTSAFCKSNRYQSTRQAKHQASNRPRIIQTKNVPIYWYAREESHLSGSASSKDDGALKQALALANSDIPVGHVAIMPDVHIGKGSVVGAVFASSDKVCPMAIGVDIGCGMTAVRIEGVKRGHLRDPQLLSALQSQFKARIPTGFNSHSSAHRSALNSIRDISEVHTPSNWLRRELANSSNGQIYAKQIGTLGGGNHFLEVLFDSPNKHTQSAVSRRQRRNFQNNNDECNESDSSISEDPSSYVGNVTGIAQFSHLVRQSKSKPKRHGHHMHHPREASEKSDDSEEDDSEVWLMLHSGSRRIGNLTASHWDSVAARKYGRVPGSDGLHWIWIDSHDGQNYLSDMQWCQEYASHNRQAMLQAMVESCESVLNCTADLSSMVCTHHNFCECEECSPFGKVWITRKGATSAKAGELGIIPGSMATGSFIVEGLGNPDSWQSCSHGAGRTMSRTEARKRLTNEQFFSRLRDANVWCDFDSKLKDEAPQAYKDLDSVIRAQVDTGLIRVRNRLVPILNVKGF